MRGLIEKSPKEEANRVLVLPNSYKETGRKEGIKQERDMIVQNMIKNGLSDRFIADMSGVDIKEVRKVRW